MTRSSRCVLLRYRAICSSVSGPSSCFCSFTCTSPPVCCLPQAPTAKARAKRRAQNADDIRLSLFRKEVKTTVRTVQVQVPGQPASPPPDETEAGASAEQAQRQAVQSALQTSAMHIESFRRELQRRVEPVQLGTDMVSYPILM